MNNAFVNLFIILGTVLFGVWGVLVLVIHKRKHSWYLLIGALFSFSIAILLPFFSDEQDQPKKPSQEHGRLNIHHISLRYKPNAYAGIELWLINHGEVPALECRLRARLNSSPLMNPSGDPIYAFDKKAADHRSLFFVNPNQIVKADIPSDYYFVRQSEYDSVKSKKLFIFLYGIITYKSNDSDSCFMSFITRYNGVDSTTFSYTDNKYNRIKCFDVNGQIRSY